MTPGRFWTQVYTYAAYMYQVQRQGLMIDPSVVRWSQAAAASIAHDEDHLRGLVKRHCL